MTPTLNLATQLRAVEKFYQDAADVLEGKSRDYAPEGVPLLNVVDSCRKWGLQPLQVLGIAYQKQETALSRYVRHGVLDSDPVRSRLVDAVNYLALMAFYVQSKDVIHERWRTWVQSQPCTCMLSDEPESCTRCARLKWIMSCLHD
jgi:hypothetical protein